MANKKLPAKKRGEHREDYLNRILVDPFADAIKAAQASGYSRTELKSAIAKAAFHAWTEIRMKHIGEPEAEQEACRFVSELSGTKTVLVHIDSGLASFRVPHGVQVEKVDFDTDGAAKEDGVCDGDNCDVEPEHFHCVIDGPCDEI